MTVPIGLIGKASSGTVTTVLDDTGKSGYLESFGDQGLGATYLATRAGSGSGVTLFTQVLTEFACGQISYPGDTYTGPYYDITESFLTFDTSTLTGTITSAVLSLWFDTVNPADADTVEARLDDWGTSLTSADWVAGAGLGAKTLLASRLASSVTTPAYNDLTDVAMVANINRSGSTRIVLSTANTRNAVVPTGDGSIILSRANQKAKLIVTTA